MVEPGTRASIAGAGVCKSQNAVSQSSTESEIIVLDSVLKPEWRPVHGLWQHMSATLHGQSGDEVPMAGRKEPTMIVAEDSTAMININANADDMHQGVAP